MYEFASEFLNHYLDSRCAGGSNRSRLFQKYLDFLRERNPSVDLSNSREVFCILEGLLDVALVECAYPHS